VRLAALLLLVGLAASRVGLLLHELGGHYAVSVGFGCAPTGLRLFLFGGGYVDYDCAAPSRAQVLAIDLGGIGLELAAGALLYAGSRRRGGALGLYLAAFGLLFVVHGLFYLVTGVHYGAGDGRGLHHLLGARRGAVVAVGSGLLVAASFGLAVELARRLAPQLASWRARARVGLLAGAVGLAVAAHGGLMLAERRVVADARYAAAFRPEHELRVERALRRFEATRARSAREVEARRRALWARHAVFPLTPVLAGAIALSALAGFGVALRRAPADGASGPAPASLARATGICALALALVLALERWVPAASRPAREARLAQELAGLEPVPGVPLAAAAALRLAVLGVVAPAAHGLVVLELDEREALAVGSLVVPEGHEAGRPPRELEHALRGDAVVGARVVAQPRAEDHHHHAAHTSAA
jgi:hypothetical protein